MNIAILILLHKYTSQQEKLIKQLSKDFNVFIHIDKSSKIKLNVLQMNNVFVFKKYPVYWGSYNQILATLYLFEQAHKCDFDRYIFISGDDIPIKSNKEIKDFFKNNNNNYFTFSPLPIDGWISHGKGFDRCDYFWINSYRGKKIRFRIVKKLLSILQILNEDFFIKFCKKYDIKRPLSKKVQLYGGANWMDLTKNCVEEILKYIKNNKWYLHSFKYTRCADEIFFQTIIINFIKELKIQNTILRYIDWESGPEYPKVLRCSDYIKIMESDKLFARKVNEEIDSLLIDKIYQGINKKDNVE